MATKRRPLTLTAFIERFGTEEACRTYLRDLRWPDGVRCPKCNQERPYLISTRHLWECRACHYQFSVMVGTVMQDSKLPLRSWFLAIFLDSQSKRGISALELQKQAGICYESAWYLLRRIRSAMSQRDRDHLLSGLIELDDAYFGGVCEGRYGRGIGQSKAAVAVAINDEGYPTYAKIRVVNAFTQDDINDSMVAVAEQGSTFLTDGLGAWRGLDQVGFEHKPEANANVPEGVEPFPCVHTLISNAKAWLAGTLHGLGATYLQDYLDEFCFRYNRRKIEHRLFERLVLAVGRSRPPVVGT